MSKSKWLVLKLDCQPKEVLKTLLKSKFSLDSGHGFEPLSRSLDTINCRFIERTVTTERIVDPFGAVTEVETTRYSTTAFRLHSRDSAPNSYLLEVSAPPRTIRPLISAFSEAFESIAVIEVAWPILDLYERIKTLSPRARIVKVRASQIPIPATSAVKVEVVSPMDAFADYRALFAGAETKVERIRIERPFLEVNGFLEISVNGLCMFDETAEEAVRSLVLSIASR